MDEDEDDEKKSARKPSIGVKYKDYQPKLLPNSTCQLSMRFKNYPPKLLPNSTHQDKNKNMVFLSSLPKFSGKLTQNPSILSIHN